MSKLTPDISAQLLDACKAGAAEAAGSLASALDCGMQIADVQAIEISPSSLPDDLQGPGLALTFAVSDEAITLLLPEATNLLPPWYVSPDVTGHSRLQTLAQELSMLLLPEEMGGGKFAAVAVDNLAEASAQAELAETAGGLHLAVSGDDGQGSFYMLWPLAQPASLLQPLEPAAEETSAEVNNPQEMAPVCLPRALPSYLQSLLSVPVPLIVTLAQTKKSVDEIVKLGPGAIIQFDKACDEMLDLEANGHHIAQGEAVKIGEKFGLRITSIRLPEERFTAIGRDV